MAGPTVISDDPGPERASAYGWTVFALSFGLLMSDHMARQVLNAAGPQIKAEWHLNNAELASLASVVALAVGLLTLPLSYLADRFGRVKSLVAMATLWSLATLAGGLGAELSPDAGRTAAGGRGWKPLMVVPGSRWCWRHSSAPAATLSASFLAGRSSGRWSGLRPGRKYRRSMDGARPSK
ncbi:MAG: MFS transporter [Sphingomonadales bacterium]|nr:MFS transporter [Sphingomonadales bacterium]